MSTDPQELAFLKVIDHNPKDEHTRLVYADWLLDHDRPEEADRQRKWCSSYKWMEEFVKIHHIYAPYYKDSDENELVLYQETLDEWVRQWLGFLEKHTTGEHWLYFDTPEFESYSDEMWEHYEILTGNKSPELTSEYRYKMPPFSCSC